MAQWSTLRIGWLVALAGGIAPAAAAQVPLSSGDWRFTRDTSAVATYRGEPALSLYNGTAWLEGADLRDGTIAFKVAFPGDRGFVGVKFRARNQENYEHFYLRPHQSGKPDANQYTPVFHGNSGWQIYHGPRYGAPVTYRYGDWIEVRLVVAGDEADVYIDGDTPALHIADLLHDGGGGGIGFDSFLTQAFIADVRITSGEAPDLTGQAPPLPATPENLVTAWQVSPPRAPLSGGVPVAPATGDVDWQVLRVEENGIANLGRMGPRRDGDTILARLVVEAARPMVKTLDLGFSDGVTAFVNGVPVYRGDNTYRSRDYRYLGTVGRFDTLLLPLEQGRNEILFAVRESFGGWALTAAFGDVDGIEIAPALGLPPEEAAARIDALVDRLWAGSRPAPGFAVVAVSGGKADLLRVEGVAHSRTRRPADEDTAFYIASMTKAYVGLLAVRLDAEDILDLDLTLAEHWPGLDLPGAADPAEITLHGLLTHQNPIRNYTIVLRAAYMEEIPPADYPALLEAASRPREPGFAYDNLGYNIYSAILEGRTGKDWKSWLEEVLFDPLGMDRTSADTSAIPEEDLSWRHEETPGGWVAIPYKTDAVMQAAGGLVTSAEDMATWLIAQTERRGPGLTGAVFAEAQRRQVRHGPEVRDRCDGHAYGWNTCTWRGIRVLEHGGGYPGMRSFMAIAPGRRAGIAVMANSDRMTGWLTRNLSELYVTYLADAEAGDERAATLVADYRERVSGYEKALAEAERDQRAHDRWDGWTWEPEAGELAVYGGRYGSEVWPDAVVEVAEDGLRLTAGDYSLVFEPAAPDLFGGKATPHSDYEVLEFRRAGSGRITGLVWKGREFTRMGTEGSR